MPIPLLLLPGLLCDGRLWRDCLPALGGLVDPRIADLSQDDSVAGMASRALELVAGEASFAVAGLSMGGYVAQEVWRQARGRIERLALLDTSARPDTPEQTKQRKALIELSHMGQFKGVTPRLMPSLVHASRLETPLAQEVMDMAARIGQAGFIRQQQAIMTRPDSRPDLPGINVPTLIACGAQDVLTPPGLHEEMAGLIPAARLVRFEGAGHLPPMEVPDATAAALKDWLTLPRSA
ncbi:alpha/beta fold hydrolase [Roseococcus sp. YIM B11640]|uniref:alpha/beta fold hydrolase n=1 Tax=Roseococcus sp. YIM B11640 TaxID=3133973 RepID=UPI003C7B761B